MSDRISEDLSKKLFYDKTYVCPMCNKDFTAKTIRIGKNQLLTIDDDLYTHYALVNPLLYDVITCPHCHYTSLSKLFDKLLAKQKEWLKDTIYALQRQNMSYAEHPTTEEAIYKYKLALLMAMTKKSKIGEQSYLALHIAWLYRDLKDSANEMIFLEKALNGFIETLEKETLPILGFDEHTVLYIISAIAYKLNKIDIAKKYLSTLIVASGIPPRIKDRALELKTKLQIS